MYSLYYLLLILAQWVLHLLALFNKKLAFFVEGRKNSFDILVQKIKPQDRCFWIHVASLGEYEQGLPLMEALQKQYPTHKVILTFFSPSGYEVKKDNAMASATLYLPLDTPKNVKRFLELAHPEKAFFVKYEYWPNYLKALKQQAIPTYLVSGVFRADQVFFKWYGGFYRKALESFSCFFVQNESSKALLLQLGIDRVMVCGDTRFDRVLQIAEQAEALDFMESFQAGQTTVVVGSSWPKDEELLLSYINTTCSKEVKFVFAPHNIKPEQIADLQSKLAVTNVLYSQSANQDLSAYRVLIVDGYGLLTRIYKYADIAYIGGGFGSGIHNILEAATYGTAVVIGPNFKKFQEAKDLIALGSCLVVRNQAEVNNTLDRLISQPKLRAELGDISKHFTEKNRDATAKIMQAIGK